MGHAKTAQSLCAEWMKRLFGAAAASRPPDAVEHPFVYAARADLLRIVELLLSAEPVDADTVIPEELVRLRAVQEISAADAVSHMFVLKDIVRERFAGERRYEELVRRLDFLALHTFNAYVRCREALYELRLREVMQYGPAETFACQAAPPKLVPLRAGAKDRAP